jgi:hypothetical protein
VKARLWALCLLLAALVGCAPSARPATCAEFLARFERLAAAQGKPALSSSAELFDLSPDELFTKTGCQIFKDGASCESYLLKGEEIRRLGSGFGGWGLTSVELCKLAARRG